MKKVFNLIATGAIVVGLGLTGCSGDVKEKGAAKEDSKTSPEMQKIIDEMQDQGMSKQFGKRADQAPTKEDDN